MFAYCGNEPVNRADCSGSFSIDIARNLMFPDSAANGGGGGTTTGSGGGIILFSLIVVVIYLFESGDEHHILHGSKNRHEAGWKKFGIDPNDPDDENWRKLLPILEEVYRNGKEISRKITDEFDYLIVYAKKFEEIGAEVILRIWQSAESGIQKVSDAWARIS